MSYVDDDLDLEVRTLITHIEQLKIKQEQLERKLKKTNDQLKNRQQQLVEEQAAQGASGHSSNNDDRQSSNKHRHQ